MGTQYKYVSETLLMSTQNMFFDGDFEKISPESSIPLAMTISLFVISNGLQQINGLQWTWLVANKPKVVVKANSHGY